MAVRIQPIRCRWKAEKSIDSQKGIFAPSGAIQRRDFRNQILKASDVTTG